MTVADRIAKAVAAHDFGTPTARKGGRNPKYPYVPVIDHSDDRMQQTEQLRGLAYVTRDEAVSRAEREIERRKAGLAKSLGERRFRALREQHGLPFELEDLEREET